MEPPDALGTFQHIADYLFEIGPTSGDQPIDWPYLESWARLMGVELDPFRAGALVALSREFLAALSKSRDAISLPALLDDQPMNAEAPPHDDR